MTAYRAADTFRPRIFVRGVLLVAPPNGGSACRVKLGALWDDHEDVTAWARTEVFVAQADTSENERRYSALAKWPRLASLCAAAPIRVVRGAEVVLLGDRDVRLFSVGFARHDGEMFSCCVERNGELLRSVTGSIHEIRRSALPGEVPYDAAVLAERVLAAATDGLVDCHSLALARLIHVVLGGGDQSPRALHQLRDDLERELDEVDTRGAAMRADAEEIARRLRDHSDGDQCAIPVYGVARRRRHPALTVRCIGEGDLASVVQNTGERLELPPYDEWLVDDVTPWQPPTRAVRVARLREELDARRLRQRVEAIATALLFVLLVALLVTLVSGRS